MPTAARGSSRPGIKEVAALAGVSWKTVTNVVHERPNVRPETRQRVLDAIDKLGYRPNLIGRNLATGRTGAIALSVPDLTQPYFSMLAHEVIKESKRRGLVALIDESFGDPAHELSVISGLLSHQVDGVIISTLMLENEQLPTGPPPTPVVLLGERASSDILDHVGVDSVASEADATAQLMELGRTKLAFVGLQAGGLGVGALRYKGFRKAIADHGGVCDPRLIKTTPEYSRIVGYDATKSLLTQGVSFDGLVCGNDLLAIGALSCLAEHGVRVPEDVAVIGWDGIPEGAFSNPVLSTVVPDVAEIAAKALDKLIMRIEGDKSAARDITAGYELLLRGST
ncbi:LacI family DNA-binding transcriptional regulator [Actinomycetaceae bacterium MB13-C1-2]|nr:LacI family DNA-binding transcriptional regulator [Actinomycetaceae bacterium MB13-C1-2]